MNSGHGSIRRRAAVHALVALLAPAFFVGVAAAVPAPPSAKGESASVAAADSPSTAPDGRQPASAPASAPPPANDWVRPEEVVERTDSLTRMIESHRLGDEVAETVGRIESRLGQLDPEIDAGFAQANAALEGSASLLTIQDARRELTGTSTAFDEWKQALEQLALRVAAVLEEIDLARARWVRTLERPETEQAGDFVRRRVLSSLEEIDRFEKDLKAARSRVLALSDRLLDRSAAVDAMLARLEKATLRQGANLLQPNQPPLWSRDLPSRLALELPKVGRHLSEFSRSTSEYVALDARPFAVQLLLWLGLVLAMRGLPAGAERRHQTSEGARQSMRVLGRPYAIATLLALMVSPALHPTAPHRVMQLLVMLAVIPVARILMLATGRAPLSLYATLLGLLALDRLAIALAALPATSQLVFLAELLTALALGFAYRRRQLDNGNPWIARVLNVAVAGVGLSVLAEACGWTTLSAVLGRGILVSATVALFIYAATLSIEALCAYALVSPTLRSSRFIDRNQAMVQQWTSVTLRVAAFVYWLRGMSAALGVRDIGADALDRVLSAGVEVGSLSLTIGGALAFGLTLFFSFVVSRLIHEILEDEVFPRTSLPRGLPHALLALTRYAIWSIGFLLALAAAGVQFNQLAILLGGLGVGIGLGLQDVVKNFAAGITLLLERRLHVGDAVQIPDKDVFGRILSIGMRASVVRNWNGAEVVMPNDDLVAGTVTNWTLSDANFRIEVTVGVAYGTDPDRVVELLIGVAAADERLLKHPAPSALFLGFGESSLDFVLRAWSDEDYDTAAQRKSDLGLAVHRALTKAGISIPFPQRDVHVASVAPAVSSALRPAAEGDRGR